MAKPLPSRPGFNVSAVARLSGVGAHTLRAWERRYGAVTPLRTPGGQRSYRLEDIERLKMLKALVEQGHAIGRLASLPEGTLRELLEPSDRATPNALPTPAPTFDIRPLLATVHDTAPTGLERELIRARLELPLSRLILDAISPLLTEVGRQVAAGKVSIAEEHRLSSVLRSHLGEIFALSVRAYDPGPHSPHPRFILSTRPGDLHEFGILLAALLASLRGCAVQYLGPNLPATEFARAARSFRATVVVAGASPLADERPQALPKYVEELARALPSPCSIWIGGTLATELPREHVPRRARGAVKLLTSLREFDEQVAELVK